MSQPAVEIFFSYAHEDEALRDKLARHLKLLEREGVIKAWHDRDITAGEEWKNAIDNHLESANIILLLISSDFLTSDYCYDIEMKRSLERHDSNQARVIPIILRSVDWHRSPFGKLAALPKDGKAVTSWQNEDEAFTDVVKGLRRSIDDFQGKTADSSSATNEKPPELSRTNQPKRARTNPPTLILRSLLISLGATVAISLARFLGVLQPLELKAYDYTLRSRPAESQDEKILVIEVNEDAEPDKSNRRNSLSDDRLDKLLQRILPYEPKIVGFDNFLNHAIDSKKYETLDESLRTGDLVAVCKAQAPNGEMFKAPDNATSVGFGDIVDDNDKIVRRHLLSMDFNAGFCSQRYALSTLLATQYLEDTSQKLQLNKGDSRVGKQKLNLLHDNQGGYWKLNPDSKKEDHGYQVMLNYRSNSSLLDGVNSSSINDIFKLPPSELKSKIKNHIVLIGTSKNTDKDLDTHGTPYGTIRGVYLQAQMTSQLVNAALEGRPLIWAYPSWGEIPMILLAAGTGALLSWRGRKLWVIVVGGGIVIAILVVSSVVLLQKVGYWFPLVPTGLGFTIVCICVTIYLLRETKPA